MKILSCYIRSFGALNNLEIDFKEGLNVFLCDNGVGKTTLISFIKAMLYGLEYKKTTKSFYERMRFLPWDGTVCGGSLTIEDGGKKYRIERNFGKKQSEDTFVLFDADTMRETNDYDERIGEKLLGVDKVSFEHSLFFGQGSLDTSITPSLNAKMGNLSDVRDDMNRFDEAIKSIDKARLEYESKGAKTPGKIMLIDEKIKESEAALEKIPVLENALEHRKRSIEEKKLRVEELLKQKDEIQKKVKLAAEKKERAGAINAKIDQKKKIEEDIADFEKLSGGRIPDSAEIETIQNKNNDLVGKTSRQEEIKERIPDKARVDFLLSIFGNENPFTKEMLADSIAEADEIARMRAAGDRSAAIEGSEKDLEQYSEFFEKFLPTTEEISAYRQYSERITEFETEIKMLQERLDKRRNDLKEAKEQGDGKPLFVMILLGALFMIIGVFFGLAVKEPIVSVAGLIGGLVVGVILILTGLVFLYQERATKRRRINENLQRCDELSDQLENTHVAADKAKSECLVFIRTFMEVPDDCDILENLIEIQRKRDEYERLLAIYESDKREVAQNTDALAELQLKLYSRLEIYAEKYGYDLFNDNKERELLNIISEDIREYDEYLENTASVLKLKNEIEILEDEISTYIDRFISDKTKTLDQRLLALKGSLDAYNNDKKRLKEIEAELEQIQEEIPEDEEASLEELQKQAREVDENYAPLVSEIAKEEEELSRILYEIEDMEEISRSLPAFIEKKAELEDRALVLADTKKYLSQAKEDFLSVYMKPLKDGMNKYIKLFVPEGVVNDIDISLDMDLSVQLLYRGQQYSGEHLSEGYKDLAAMCARLALIDILYKSKRPTFLMDDPFTNLDEKKIQKALKILDMISADTQIIYFTCHASRTKGDKDSFGIIN